MSSTGEDVLVGRSYTRARRSPLVIGKLPGAGRLPGGPYTITQVVTMVLVFVVLITTKALWAHFGPGNVLVMVAVPWGLAFALRYARMDGRDPARALLGVFTYASTPRAGRLAGRPVRLRRPALLDTRITLTPQAPAAALQPSPARPVQAPAARPAAAPRAPEGLRPRRAAAAGARPGAVAVRGPVAAPRPGATGPRAGARTPAARTALQALLAELGED
ncbi:hypothetical protein ACFY00_32955 [Kitasatospora sp. NPDC001540]|uniref:hypothetical protein n=1 Tax=Kitasatospora sp. NPDC001540 TaxID=3364014 RepID=UPI00367DADE0